MFTKVQTIEKAIKRYMFDSYDFTHSSSQKIHAYAISNVDNLKFFIEFKSGTDADTLSITDENNEDNIAVMYPIKDNNRSLARCLTMCMNEVIDHA